MVGDTESEPPVNLRAVYLGLGSNLGDRLAQLRGAVSAIPELAAVSPLYESEPVGGPEQGAFLNIVVLLETWRTARELLNLCHELEQAANRERTVRWGPRTLDVDLLYIEGETVNEADLIVPHPRMHERNFVMQPLLDLAPDMAVVNYDPESAIGAVTKVGPL